MKLDKMIDEMFDTITLPLLKDQFENKPIDRKKALLIAERVLHHANNNTFFIDLQVQYLRVWIEMNGTPNIQEFLERVASDELLRGLLDDFKDKYRGDANIQQIAAAILEEEKWMLKLSYLITIDSKNEAYPKIKLLANPSLIS